MTAALTAEEVAAQFGHSRTWIYENWRRLVAEKRLPPPLEEAGHLVWSAAQVYAYLDKDLPENLRALTAAHRAAMDAAAAAPKNFANDQTVESHRAALDARFRKREHA